MAEVISRIMLTSRTPLTSLARLSCNASMTIRYRSTKPEIKDELKPFEMIPGPKEVPLLGNSYGFKAPGVGADPKENITILKHLWKEYGDMIKFKIPGRDPIVFLFDPDLCEKVYRAAGATPMRPGFDALRHTRNSDSLTKSGGAVGLLTSSGMEWQQFRSKVQQPMLRPKSTLRYTPDLEAIAEEFIQAKIMDKRDKNSMKVGADFLDDLYKWALESVSCLALNARLGCLKPNLPEDSHQMRIIRAVSDIFSTSMYLDNSLQLWRLAPFMSPKLKAFQGGYYTFKELCLTYIAEALNEIKNKNVDEETGDPTLLEMFFSRGCDEDTAVVMAMDMMFAGIDTSSHLSAYIFYHLAKNPEIQEKLHQEVLTHLPTKSSKLNKNALDKMPYLRAVIKETLRVTPPVTVMARVIDEPLELGGYKCPPNVLYGTAHYFMSNSDRYVDNPEKYQPERWIRENNGEGRKMHPFLMMPFGHGPRMCVGKRFAEQEVAIMVAKIMQNFRIEWHNASDLVIKTETITKPYTPLEFTFVDR